MISPATSSSTTCATVFTASHDWTISGYDTVYEKFNSDAHGWINNIESKPFVVKASADGSLSNRWNLKLVGTEEKRRFGPERGVACQLVLMARPRKHMVVHVKCDFDSGDNLSTDANSVKLNTAEVGIGQASIISSVKFSSKCSFRLYMAKSFTLHFTFSHYLDEKTQLSRVDSGNGGRNSDVAKFVNSAKYVLRDLYSDSRSSDVTIETAKGEFIPAHKAVLSIQSSVFKRMFQVEMQESVQNSVKIVDFPSDSVKCALRYLYGQEEEQEKIENCAEDMLAFGEKYDISTLKNDAIAYLSCQVRIGSVCGILVQADRHRAPNLVQKCVEFIGDHREMVIVSNEWAELVRDHGALVQRVKDAAFTT